jgi:hypothetical protein
MRNEKIEMKKTEVVMHLPELLVRREHGCACRYKYATEGTVALLVGILSGGCFALYFAVVHNTGIPHRLVEFNASVRHLARA